MTENKMTTSSRLLEYLPSIYQEDSTLGQFLSAFEKVLLGRKEETGDLAENEVLQKIKGLEELISGISSFFDPGDAPKEFLPWLAGWVAFSLRSDVDEIKQRKFIANMTELYRWRGTEKNLKQLFLIFTDREPVLPPISDTAEAHFFKVSLDLTELVRGRGESEADRHKALDRQIAIAHALIQMEKPAHTRYQVELIFPSFQIGGHEPLTNFQTQVGINTRLGVAEWSN
jgi:phage tail-like protein